jgi:hypothetical protein
MKHEHTEKSFAFVDSTFGNALQASPLSSEILIHTVGIRTFLSGLPVDTLFLPF